MTTARSPIIQIDRSLVGASSWVDTMPYMGWTDIPNSYISSSVPGEGVDPVVHLASLDIPVNNTTRTRYGGYDPISRSIYWPVNKFGTPITYGHGNSGYDDCAWGGASGPHSTYGNPGHDIGIQSTQSAVYFYQGDADYSDNSVFKLNLDTTPPSWTKAVQGCSILEFRNVFPQTQQETDYIAANPAQDTRFYRNMDGSSHPGHMYNSVIYCHPRNWIVQFDNRQLHPVDTGYVSRVTVADLSTQRWLTSVNEEAGVPPFGSSDNSDAGCIWSNQATGDFYALRETRMITYDAQAADPRNAWTTNFNISTSSENACAGCRWTDSVSLVYALGSGDNCYFWLYNHATSTRTVLTMAGSAAARFSSYAQAGKPKQYGIIWNPDLAQWMLGSPIWNEPTTNTWTVSISGTVATVEPLITATPMFAPGVFVNQGKSGGVRNGWAYHPKLGGVVIMQEDNYPLRFLRTRPLSTNSGAFLLGTDPTAVSNPTYSRSLVMTAEAPFTGIQLMFVNWSASAQTVANAVVGTSATLNMSNKQSPDRALVAVTVGGSGSNFTVPAAPSAPTRQPGILLSDVISVTSATPNPGDENNPGHRPLAYVRTFESANPTEHGDIPSNSWQTNVGNTYQRILDMQRANVAGNLAHVGDTFVPGSPTNAWVVPIFKYSVKAKTVMFVGDSTTKGTGSVSNGDGSFPSIACMMASTQSRPITPFIVGLGGYNMTAYIDSAKAFIDAGFRPDACVFEVGSPNSSLADTSQADAVWASALAFETYLIGKGIIPVFQVRLPSTNCTASAFQYLVDLTRAYGTSGGYVLDATSFEAGGLQAARNSNICIGGGAGGTYQDADGIHFKQAGYTFIATAAQSVLNVIAAL